MAMVMMTAPRTLSQFTVDDCERHFTVTAATKNHTGGNISMKV